MSESDLSSVLENNMRSIIESDNSAISSSHSHHYGHNGHIGSTSSTPVAHGKQGSFFSTFLGGYQTRGTLLSSPAFKSRSTVHSTSNNSHIGHTSSMHDFVSESGTKVADLCIFLALFISL